VKEVFEMTIKSVLSRLAMVSLFVVTLSTTAWADTRRDRLIDLLESSSSYRVRAQSALSLGRLGGDEAVEALIGALDDEHQVVRATAAHSLGRIATPEARRALEQAAVNADQPDAVIAHVRDSLQRIQLLARR
jgi:HEAT repeat protein